MARRRARMALWFNDSLYDSMIHSMIQWFNLMIQWFNDSMIHSMIQCMIQSYDSMIHSMIQWFTEE
jgi:hypothetical protein